MKKVFEWLNAKIAKRVKLAFARAEWAYDIELWKENMTCYNGMLTAGFEGSLKNAEYYLDQAKSFRDQAEAATAEFGSEAKRAPTLADKIVVFVFGRWYI